MSSFVFFVCSANSRNLSLVSEKITKQIEIKQKKGNYNTGWFWLFRRRTPSNTYSPWFPNGLFDFIVHGLGCVLRCLLKVINLGAGFDTFTIRAFNEDSNARSGDEQGHFIDIDFETVFTCVICLCLIIYAWWVWLDTIYRKFYPYNYMSQ